MAEYEAVFVPACTGYMCKLSDTDESGGGAYTSYLIRILRDGKEYVDTGEYVEKLSPYNNKLQDQRVRSASCWPVLAHDAELGPQHMYGKAAHLLAALRAYAE